MFSSLSFLFWNTVLLPSPAAIFPFPPNLFLVHAKASIMSEGRPAFVIDRVYVGAEILNGKVFRVLTYSPLMAPLFKNEEGFWWIRRDSGKVGLVAERVEVLRGWGLADFPMRRGFSANPRDVDGVGMDKEMKEIFANGVRITRNLEKGRGEGFARAYHEWEVRFVHAIKKVYRANSIRERLTLLKGYAASDDIFATDGSQANLISPWAMQFLRKARPARLDSFAKELIVKKSLPAPTEVIIDKLLCEELGGEWQESAERWKMLERWLHVSRGYANDTSGESRKRCAPINSTSEDSSACLPSCN